MDGRISHVACCLSHVTPNSVPPSPSSSSSGATIAAASVAMERVEHLEKQNVELQATVESLRQSIASVANIFYFISEKFLSTNMLDVIMCKIFPVLFSCCDGLYSPHVTAYAHMIISDLDVAVYSLSRDRERTTLNRGYSAIPIP
jgi:hypothetical protein